jgi:hypothetical protein
VPDDRSPDLPVGHFDYGRGQRDVEAGELPTVGKVFNVDAVLLDPEHPLERLVCPAARSSNSETHTALPPTKGHSSGKLLRKLDGLGLSDPHRVRRGGGGWCSGRRHKAGSHGLRLLILLLLLIPLIFIVVLLWFRTAGIAGRITPARRNPSGTSMGVGVAPRTRRVVTAAVDAMEFKEPAQIGEVLTCKAAVNAVEAQTLSASSMPPRSRHCPSPVRLAALKANPCRPCMNTRW